MKNDVSSGATSKTFYYLDWRDDFLITENHVGELNKYLYNGEVVRQFRLALEVCIVATFDRFKWEDIVLKGEKITLPTCNMPVAFLVDDVIEIVRLTFSTRVNKIKKEGKLQLSVTLDKLWKAIGPGYIAELCVDLTQSFRVNKNWNSHGAKVGAAVCELGSLLAMIGERWYTLEGEELWDEFDVDFRQKMPRGEMLTGQMHGSEDNVYMEYLLAPYDGIEPLLSYTRMFKTPTAEPAAKRVANLTDNLKTGDHLSQRPTKAHTLDFMCSYKGIHLVDRECKDVSQ